LGWFFYTYEVAPPATKHLQRFVGEFIERYGSQVERFNSPEAIQTFNEKIENGPGFSIAHSDYAFLVSSSFGRDLDNVRINKQDESNSGVYRAQKGIQKLAAIISWLSYYKTQYILSRASEQNIKEAMHGVNAHLNAMIKDKVEKMNVGVLGAGDDDLAKIREWLDELGFNYDNIQLINEHQAKLHENDPNWLIVRWDSAKADCDIIIAGTQIPATRTPGEPEDSYKHRFQNVVREAV